MCKRYWGLRFDDVPNDALELGSLRSTNISLSPALEQRIETATPKGVPMEVLRTLIGHYLAKRQEDTDWVVLPQDIIVRSGTRGRLSAPDRVIAFRCKLCAL